jgi:hypothetical protein
LKKLGQWMEMEWVGKDKFWKTWKNWTMDENGINWQKMKYQIYLSFP